MNMNKVTISTDPNLFYPIDGSLSPDSPFPEYPFGDHGNNCVYALVRRALAEHGCDPRNLGTTNWSPLSDWVNLGDQVFILPNFVMHRRSSESAEQFQSKCTHASVIRAVMDYATIAAGSADLVKFGNAAIQGCDYNILADQVGATAIASFYKHHGGADAGPHDLRSIVTKWSSYGTLLEHQEQNQDQLVYVDLGSDSLLDEFYSSDDRMVELRVGDYNPDETTSFHSLGRHVYVLNRRVLEAKVIISVPKLKTHQKVGITCALKGTVGTIGRKECLAHHRKGSPENDGDEFPRGTLLHNLASDIFDATAKRDTSLLNNLQRVAGKILGRGLRIGPSGIMGGAWHGNDTAWRMTLDIARILRYADTNGVLHQSPQRKHLAFVDGVIGGEREGPLNPSPRHVGAILFGADICEVDVACARIMGYDPGKIPLIANSFQPMSYPITDYTIDNLHFFLNRRLTSGQELNRFLDTPFVATKGWRGLIEAEMETEIR